MEIILLLILGLCFGSFLNVLIWRLNTQDAPKFWQGRSICPKCRHELVWADNVPLLSFLSARGRCRYCDKPISWQYPVVELITALIFILIGLNVFTLIIACGFIVIFFSDLIYGYVSDSMVGTIIIASLFSGGSVLTGLFTALFFFLLRLVANFFARKEAMGVGDITLAAAMGTYLGWPKIGVALWMGFVIGGILALVLILLKKTKLSATIPLGPFLITGLIIAALWTKNVLGILLLN